MNALDFLSESPNIFIFQKDTNKTNFGGVLFLLYILVMILISIAYILEYAFKEDFSYEALTFYNKTDSIQEIEEINEDENLNPFMNLTFAIYQFGKEKDEYRENYLIAEHETYSFLKENYRNTWYRLSYYNIRKKVSEIELEIYYNCSFDKNCSNFDSLYTFFGTLYVTFESYSINHTNNRPVTEYNPSFDFSLYKHDFESKMSYRNATFEWESIVYKDQKGLFDTLTKKQTDYVFGHIKNNAPTVKIIKQYDNYSDNVVNLDGYGYLLPVMKNKFINPHEEYLYYKRQKKEILDVFAKIGALFSTVNFFFSLFFSFYSKNFDNYKILEKILKTPKKPIKEIELTTDIEPSPIENKEEDVHKLKDINSKEPLIDKDVNENEKKLIAEDVGAAENIDEKNHIETDSYTLRKLSFIDFLFNNIYSKFFKKNKNQELINSINGIMYKYLSIDSLLYNQIKLENLFKDYKWNNPILNNIHNNKMINELKTC